MYTSLLIITKSNTNVFIKIHKRLNFVFYGKSNYFFKTEYFNMLKFLFKKSILKCIKITKFVINHAYHKSAERKYAKLSRHKISLIINDIDNSISGS